MRIYATPEQLEYLTSLTKDAHCRRSSAKAPAKTAIPVKSPVKATVPARSPASVASSSIGEDTTVWAIIAAAILIVLVTFSLARQAGGEELLHSAPVMPEEIPTPQPDPVWPVEKWAESARSWLRGVESRYVLWLDAHRSQQLRDDLLRQLAAHAERSREQLRVFNETQAAQVNCLTLLRGQIEGLEKNLIARSEADRRWAVIATMGVLALFLTGRIWNRLAPGNTPKTYAWRISGNAKEHAHAEHTAADDGATEDASAQRNH